jgi:hypothetical protein
MTLNDVSFIPHILKIGDLAGNVREGPTRRKLDDPLSLFPFNKVR